MIDSGPILITGADGYIGNLLACRLLATTDDPIVLLVRAMNQDELQRKRVRLASQFGKFGRRIIVKGCDLTHTDAFDAIDRTAVRTIIHAGAVTRFNVDREEARRINIEGTKTLLRFAQRCPGLETFMFLSTLHSSGLQGGLYQEIAVTSEPEFANHYEWSKWRAENVLIQGYDHLPWKICRLATVIANSDSGTVVQWNVFHNSLRLYHHGLLSLVPGNPGTPLYLITGAFATDAILSVISKSRHQMIYHVSHRKMESATLGELISIAFDRFEEYEEFRRKRVLRPMFVDLESFNSLASAVSGLGGELIRQATASIHSFSQQLFVTKDISNENLVADYPAYIAPDPRRLIADTCDHLLRMHWEGGKRHAA